jgi:hypothetical protein
MAFLCRKTRISRCILNFLPYNVFYVYNLTNKILTIHFRAGITGEELNGLV